MRHNPAVPTWLALWAMLLVPTAASAAEQFEDWSVDCRTDGYCAAESLGGDSHRLRIGRHATETYWELSLSTPSRPDLATPVTVAVDSAVETFAAPGEVAPYGAATELFFLGAKAQAVMDRLPAATRLTVSFGDLAGTRLEAEFPLAGLDAALIWIDERQGRLGSERVAAAPPFGLALVGDQAGAPALPAPIASVPAELLQRHAAICEDYDVTELDRDVFVEPLPDERTLYLLPCHSGAYNAFYSVYVGHGSWYEELWFATPTYAAGWQAEPGVWLDSYEPAMGRLRSYNRGRGMGDCGMRGLWEWRGSQFAMLRYTLKPDCDGSGEPGEFPIVFELQPAAPSN